MTSINSLFSPTSDGIMKTFVIFTIFVLAQSCLAHTMFTGLTSDKYLCKPENLKVKLKLYLNCRLKNYYSMSLVDQNFTKAALFGTLWRDTLYTYRESMQYL